MTKIQKFQRLNIVLGGVAVVLLLVLLLRAPATSAVCTEALDPLLPDMPEVKSVRSVSLRRMPRAGADTTGETPEEVRLVRTPNDTWVLATTFGYPASKAKVELL